MADFDFEDRYDLYNQVHDSLEALTEDVSIFKSENLYNIYYQDYIDFFETVEKVEFTHQEMPGYLGEICSGMLFPDKHQWIIAVNPTMVDTRMHFTAMHEILHLLNDVTLEHNNFQDSFEVEDTPQEYRAEIGAELLMINDWALSECIVNKYSWSKIQRSFGISSQALHYRMIDFFAFEIGLTQQHAQVLSRLYENGTYEVAYRYASKFYGRKLHNSNEKVVSLAIMEFENPYFENGVANSLGI